MLISLFLTLLLAIESAAASERGISCFKNIFEKSARSGHVSAAASDDPLYKDFLTKLKIIRSQDIDPDIFRHPVGHPVGVPKDIREVSRLISETGHKVDTVLYPASGIDADGVVVLFPDATNYIGLDPRPFFISGSKPRPPSETLSGQKWNGWEKIDAVTQSTGAFAALSQRLRDAGYRIRKITAFFEKRTRPDERLLVAGKPVCNGVIEFDQGDGTSIRRYWHIDFRNELGMARPGTPESASNIFEVLGSNPPDAVLVKGSMASLRSRNERRGDLPGHILRWLKRKHGILVEGFNTSGDGEFFLRGERTEEIHDIELSYDRGVRINEF